MRTLRTTILGAFFCLSFGTAQASIGFFVGDIAEDFEGFTAGKVGTEIFDPGTGISTTYLDIMGGEATMSRTSSFFIPDDRFIVSEATSEHNPAAGTQMLGFSIYNPSVTFDFTNPISSFGFYMSAFDRDFFGDGSVIPVEFSINGTPFSYDYASQGPTMMWVGMDFAAPTSQVQVNFSVFDESASFFVDEIQANKVGSPDAVPEPASILAMSLGISALAARRLRRNRKD